MSALPSHGFERMRPVSRRLWTDRKESKLEKRLRLATALAGQGNEVLDEYELRLNGSHIEVFRIQRSKGNSHREFIGEFGSLELARGLVPKGFNLFAPLDGDDEAVVEVWL